MIIDGHLIIRTPANELDAYGRYLAAHGRGAGWESPTALVENLDADGVDFGLLLEGPNRLRESFVARAPARLGAFAFVSIRDLIAAPDRTLADARARIAAGFRGFGQLTPYREGVGVDHPALVPLLELACELKVPVHFECTCTGGLPAPGRVSTPIYDFEALALRYPQLSIILGSWGGTMCLQEMMPELPPAMLNVYYDTASPVDAFDVGIMLRTVTKVVRSRKVLFGSASPLLPRDLAAYRNAGVAREVLFGVLGNNLKLLLGLK